MKPIQTRHGIKALSELDSLEPDERLWVVDSALRGAKEDMQLFVLNSLLTVAGSHVRDEIKGLLQAEPLDDARNKPPTTYAAIRGQLLDDPNLSPSDRTILAAIAICELYELTQFTARQVSEFIRETGNDPGNITGVLSALANRGLIEVIAKTGDTQQAQKRYALSTAGETRGSELLSEEKKTRIHARSARQERESDRTQAGV